MQERKCIRKTYSDFPICASLFLYDFYTDYLSMPDTAPFLVSFRLAFTTVVVLLVVAVPLAYILAITKHRLKPLVESIVSLPIALPPTVVGFYFLYAFGRGSAFGAWLADSFDVSLVFSFSGLVLGSVLYSLPFMVQPVKNGFEAISTEIRESAVLDGATGLQVFMRVALPIARRSLLTGSALAFVHALGEFGIVMMIGGNISGETRTASIALYDAVQALDYGSAHIYAAILLGVALLSGIPAFQWWREK
jgi:molybdate transport system permease protein